MEYTGFRVQLPRWMGNFIADQGTSLFATHEDRMQLAVELSRLNIVEGTGGPFGAAIFDMDNGRLLSAGVNLVVSSNCSMLHAEIVAITVAQQLLGAYDLGSNEKFRYELVTSTEPCAMCLGAIPWSGVRRVVCGARGEDASAIGFDEGHKPPEWDKALERRGISVLRDVCLDKAASVLRQYGSMGGVIYNGRQYSHDAGLQSE